jgi:hypothetical protein
VLMLTSSRLVTRTEGELGWQTVNPKDHIS